MRKRQLRIIRFIALLFSAHVAILSYISSSFLVDSRSFTNEEVGLIFSLGSLLSLIALYLAPRIYTLVGMKRLFNGSLLFAIVTLVSVALFPSQLFVTIVFPIYLAVTSISYYLLDVATEHYTINSKTGSTRALILLFASIAWLIFPSLGSYLIGFGFDYNHVLLLSAGLALVVFSVSVFELQSFKLSVQQRLPLIASVRRFFSVHAFRHDFWIRFLLQSLSAVTIIYVPLFLSQVVGFSWDTITLILLIMLSPYFFELIPLGKLADSTLGEKELMITSLCLIIITLLTLWVVDTSSWLVYAGILFFLKAGTGALDMLTDSYFFKHADDQDGQMIALYREAYPLAYLIAPLVMSLLLTTNIIELQHVWIVAAIATLLVAVPPALKLSDTR